MPFLVFVLNFSILKEWPIAHVIKDVNNNLTAAKHSGISWFDLCAFSKESASNLSILSHMQKIQLACNLPLKHSDTFKLSGAKILAGPRSTYSFSPFQPWTGEPDRDLARRLLLLCYIRCPGRRCSSIWISCLVSSIHLFVSTHKIGTQGQRKYHLANARNLPLSEGGSDNGKYQRPQREKP